jgi:hypothetical protein
MKSVLGGIEKRRLSLHHLIYVGGGEPLVENIGTGCSSLEQVQVWPSFPRPRPLANTFHIQGE